MKINYRKLSQLLSLAVIPFVLESCSVIMAAKKEGTNIETIQASHTRGQFLACGAKIICSERLPTGELVEVYQYQKESGSAVRALMHGVLDISTMGLWEVVGTPIEACASEAKYFIIKVYYDEYENATKVELL